MTARGATPMQVSEPRESITVYNKHVPNTPMLVGGAVLLGATYATTAAFVGANGKIGDHDLYIPIVGPWINLADRSCVGDCPHDDRDKALIVASGIGQGAGALLGLVSFFVPEKVPAARIQAGPVKMIVAPTAGGVGAVGTF
jgi:hypothetical protein